MAYTPAARTVLAYHKERFEEALQETYADFTDLDDSTIELDTLYNALNYAHSYIRKLEESNPQINPGA